MNQNSTKTREELYNRNRATPNLAKSVTFPKSAVTFTEIRTQDLQRVWLVMDGVHELRNVVADSLAVREWTFNDHLAVQDEDLLQKNLNIGEGTQQEVELDAAMFADVDEALLAKKTEMELQRSSVSMRKQISDIKANRRAEKKLSIARAQALTHAADFPPSYVASSSPPSPLGREKEPLSPAYDALRRFIKNRSLT